jgi:hypothetical protein
MWPIQLAFRLLISCRIFFCCLTLSNTTSFLTWWVQLISILLQHHISKLSRCFWSTFYINALTLSLLMLYIYISRTAPLTSRCILYIYSTNIHTEYFKHAAHSPFFSLQNAVSFIILPFLVHVLFTFYIQGVLKFKNKFGSLRVNLTQFEFHRPDLHIRTHEINTIKLQE